jgi:type IV secretory pathway VirB3-like protein
MAKKPRVVHNEDDPQQGAPGHPSGESSGSGAGSESGEAPPPDRDDHIPPGWKKNPAAWSERLPIVGLALVGFSIAMYLSLYQWEVFDRIWEPFFGNENGFDGESKEILRGSSVSKKTMKWFGVPDGFLGALGYFVDAVTGAVGGTTRWKTMPWIVIVFGLAVGPLGVVSIMLVVSQPVFFSAFCTLCLASAVVSVAMIGPAMDEMLASLQYIKRVRQEGGSFWKAFWGLS